MKDDFPETYSRLLTSPGKRLNESTLVYFAMDNFIFQSIEQSAKIGKADLFSGLGGTYVVHMCHLNILPFAFEIVGNLSLWLGGSFIALIHLIVYPIRLALCGGPEGGGLRKPSSVQQKLS